MTENGDRRNCSLDIKPMLSMSTKRFILNNCGPFCALSGKFLVFSTSPQFPLTSSDNIASTLQAWLCQLMDGIKSHIANSPQGNSPDEMRCRPLPIVYIPSPPTWLQPTRTFVFPARHLQVHICLYLPGIFSFPSHQTYHILDRVRGDYQEAKSWHRNKRRYEQSGEERVG